MRTTLNIPDKLLDEACELTGVTTKTQAILIALNELIQRRKSLRILELKGSMKEDYNYKVNRTKR